MKILIQTQLSNYDISGKFILECDSGWQMVINRARTMLELDNDLEIDILCPILETNEIFSSQVKTHPNKITPDLFKRFPDRLNLIEHGIIPNALASRFDFDFEWLSSTIPFEKQYDIVYINDPMLLRNFKTLFKIKAGYTPKFVVHSHFIDDPACPKFPVEASLWMGQCEAARRADYNFWQCESAMNIFFDQFSKEYAPEIVEMVRKKSAPWDDGYSINEINLSHDWNNIRFSLRTFNELTHNKYVIFVPNRIGEKGRSSDYTGCGHFMFNVLPKLRKLRNDYVVICGNPSQKILNNELVQRCGENGFINLVPDSLNRDEYKFVASRSDLAIGLYREDSYGGTAARECIELGCLPIWVDNYEYKNIASQAAWDYLVKQDMTDCEKVINNLLQGMSMEKNETFFRMKLQALKNVVRKRCAYEHTTSRAFDIVKNLV